MPRSRAILAARIASMITPAEFGESQTSSLYSRLSGTSPNSAGVIIDAIRAAKIALDRGIGGPLLSAASYFMKSPPEQYGDDAARDAVEKFIRGEVDR